MVRVEQHCGQVRNRRDIAGTPTLPLFRDTQALSHLRPRAVPVRAGEHAAVPANVSASVATLMS